MAKNPKAAPQAAPAHVVPTGYAPPNPGYSPPAAPAPLPPQPPTVPPQAEPEPARRRRAPAAPAPQPPQPPQPALAPYAGTSALVSLGPNLPALPADLAAGLRARAGAGLENVTASDLAIPFLSLLQPLSPQCQRGSADAVEGAEPGDFFDTASRELWAGAEGIDFIPCSYQRFFVEWVPRNRGGGFVARHGEDAGVLKTAIRSEDGRDVLPSGNELVDTAYFYGLVHGERGWCPAVLSFQRTQRKKARNWLSLISGQKLQDAHGTFTPPMYAFAYRITSGLEQNDRGSWYGFSIDARAQVVQDPATFKSADEFAEQIRVGRARLGDEGGRAETAPGSADPRTGFAGPVGTGERPF